MDGFGITLFDEALEWDGVALRFPHGEQPAVLWTAGHGFADVWDDQDPVQFVVKCDPDEAEALCDIHPCIQPGYHTNKRHWISVFIDGSLDDSELRRLLRNSYHLVRRERDHVVPAELSVLDDTVEL